MRKTLRKARKDAGYTQLQLSILIGCGQQCIAKHELGITTPNHFSIIREYEQVLRCPAEELFPDIFLNS